MERIHEVKNVLGHDNKAAIVLDGVLNAAKEYVIVVRNMERTLSVQKFRMEGEDLRQLTTDLDWNRRRKHDILLDSIRIANRYFMNHYPEVVEEGGIYAGSSDRNAVGDWAFHLVEGNV